MKVTIREGDILPPWYYGIAYRDWVSDRAIFYPIPLNLIVRWTMILLYWWNRQRSRERYHLLTSDGLALERQKAYELGRRHERSCPDVYTVEALAAAVRLMEEH